MVGPLPGGAAGRGTGGSNLGDQISLRQRRGERGGQAKLR